MTNNLRPQLKALPLERILPLTPSPKAGKDFYNCPACGSGTHANGTGALHPKKGGGWKCESCGRDSVGILMEAWGTDFKGTLARLEELGHITIGLDIKAAAQPGAATSQAKANLDKIWEWARELQRNQEAKAYLESRGLSAEYPLGFCGEHWRGTRGQDFFRRIIIPLNDEGTAFTARAIDQDTEPRYYTEGEAVWNHYRALQEEGDHIFIVEGALDGWAMIQAGQPTLALLGAANWRTLAEKVREGAGIGKRFILALDNDERGREATRYLAKAFQEAGVEFVKAQLPTEYKDQAEFAAANREAFVAWAEREARREAFPSTAEFLATEFDRAREAFITACGLKTGWPKLDKELGGMRPGLYVMGAASSVGKTTWALQLTDQIAQQGKHALYVSLEQSTYDLLCKSLARYSHTIAKANASGVPTAQKAWTNREIMLGKEAPQFELDTIKEAYTKGTGGRVRILAGSSASTYDSIARAARALKEKGALDFLVIDYLQIVRAEGYRDDKQRVDFLVGELKRLSNELDIPVLALASLNRQNYNQPVNMESFKESGGIEYTADCLLGLQASVLEYHDKEKEAETRTAHRNWELQKERALVLKCLKNRMGSKWEIPVKHLTTYDTFQEE